MTPARHVLLLQAEDEPYRDGVPAKRDMGPLGRRIWAGTGSSPCERLELPHGNAGPQVDGSDVKRSAFWLLLCLANNLKNDTA